MTRWTAQQLAAHKSGQKQTKRKENPESYIQPRNGAAVLIGIDPGTHTGIAIKNDGFLEVVETVTIWEALNLVRERAEYYGRKKLFVRVEDARQRTWFGSTGKERWRGAGSIARDCAIWEEALTQMEIPFEMVHPKHVKETTAEYFKKLTGWQGRTSKHAREAAWLIL